jgi:hypothetical protein
MLHRVCFGIRDTLVDSQGFRNYRDASFRESSDTHPRGGWKPESSRFETFLLLKTPRLEYRLKEDPSWKTLAADRFYARQESPQNLAFDSFKKSLPQLAWALLKGL